MASSTASHTVDSGIVGTYLTVPTIRKRSAAWLITLINVPGAFRWLIGQEPCLNGRVNLFRQPIDQVGDFHLNGAGRLNFRRVFVPKQVRVPGKYIAMLVLQCNALVLGQRRRNSLMLVLQCNALVPGQRRRNSRISDCVKHNLVILT